MLDADWKLDAWLVRQTKDLLQNAVCDQLHDHSRDHKVLGQARGFPRISTIALSLLGRGRRSSEEIASWGIEE